MAGMIASILIAIAVFAAIMVWVFYSKGDARFKMDIGGSAPHVAGGADGSAHSGVRGRLIGLGAVVGGMFVLLATRIFSMQILSGEDYAKQAESNRTRTISLAAPRGRILDRNGVEIVSNRPSLTVVASPDVASNEIEVQLLANLLGMPKQAVKRNIEDQTEGAQSSRTVAIDVSRRVVAYIGEHPSLFEGVSIEERSERYYPLGAIASHVVGYTGTITTEQLENSNNSTDEGAISYEAGDTVGQSGVEYQYESVLQGIRGEQTVVVNADGDVLGYSSKVAPKSGSDVVLTLDANLQKAAEASLDSVISAIRNSVSKDCKSGSALVLDATNGEILAMASRPNFSPNIFVGGISNDDWDQLGSESSDYPLVNRAISGTYPSASTIKPLSTFAALDDGIATPNSSYYCAGWWTGFGEASGKWCWQKTGHGTLNLQGGITYSCDVVFYEIGKGYFLAPSNNEGMQAKFRAYGLGSLTGIDLPGESAGRVPDAQWKYDYYSSYPEEDRQWKGGDYANLAIGQGDLLVTPLQMACAYASIANGGDIWTPHVLKSVKSATGTGSVIDYKQSVLRTCEESDTYRQIVNAGLLGVIEEESAYQTRHFAGLPVSVSGKSGTAERSGHQPTGWFIAYAPADDPKYVVASALEEATWGGYSAMYVVRDILGAIYDAPDDELQVMAGITSGD
ncbi:MAG: penicillin-binding protein 2 [Atopobiaceae bacterium]|jgi:penicillin-binding protein 2